MTTARRAGSRLKIYNDHVYVHTTLVRHQGTTVALALDSARRLYYSVLDLDAAAALPAGEDESGNPDLDVRHWAEDPKELPFPQEITRAGYAALGADLLPCVRKGSRAEEGEDDYFLDEEIDPFLSSTARLTAAVPFQALSDGRHVFVFRQAVAASHSDALHRTPDGDVTGTPDGNLDIAADALLCDRFVLAGGDLKPVQEVRYRRSRHRDRPESAKDSLGIMDMDGKPFLEPTLELGFVGRITEGRFSALLVPTAVADVRRWQFFVHNAKSQRIDAINVEQGEDGLFHTQGTRFHTSPDPQYQDSVLERSPGTCPFTGKPLIQVPVKAEFAESAMKFWRSTTDPSKNTAHLEAPAPTGFGTGAYTIEAWIKPAARPGTIVATDGGLALSLDADGRLTLAHGSVLLASGTGVHDDDGAATVVPQGRYTHVCALYDGVEAALYVGDLQVAIGPLAPAATPTKLFIAAKSPTDDLFAGVLDEMRLWSRDRKPERVAATRGERLVGDEPGLAAYYRFDETVHGGGGTFDQTDNGLDARIRGTGGVWWVASEAPVADHPGIRRDCFRVLGRSVVGGLSAVLLHQQEEAASGHDGRLRPLKRQARVLLTWTTSASHKDKDKRSRIAALDLAVGRDGRLAQMTDNLDLPSVGSAIEEVDPAEENRLKAEIAVLEKDLATAEEQLNGLRLDLKDPGRIRNAFREALGTATTAAGMPTASGGKTDCWVYIDNDIDIRLLKVADPDGDGEYEPVTAVELADPSDRPARWQLEKANSYHRLISAVTKEVLAPDGGSVVLRRDPGAALWLDFQARGAGYRMKTGINKDGGTKGTMERGYGNLLHWDDRDRKLVMRGGEGDRVAVYCVAMTPADDKAKQAAAALAAAEVRRRLVADGPANIAGHTDRITRLKDSLAAKQERLGRITGGTKGRSNRTLPMVQLGQDRLGLGWAGAVLDFATTSGSPFLAESGTGHIGLYYRDDHDRFTGLFYETTIGRAGKVLATSNNTTVHLTARDAGCELAKYEVRVAADTVGPFADRCTLTLTGGDGGSETWTLLPRAASGIVAALNGVRAEPVAVGTVASFKDGALTLAAPGARRALAAGDLIDVGGTTYALTTQVAAKATGLRLTHGPSDATIAAGTAVRLVSYAPELVTHERPGSGGAYGSRFVTAALIGGSGEVKDGTATDEGEARPSRWWGDLPGRALNFAATTEPPALPPALRSAARHADDLTIEAWLKPEEGDVARVVHANLGEESQYTLALGTKDTTGRRPVVLGVGTNFAASRATVAAGEWTHVAAAFEQSWGLRFAHQAYADTPHADDLNISKDLTLEVFLQTGELGSAQGVLSKGRVDDGGGGRVPYQFGIEADGRLFFAFEDADGNEVRLNSANTGRGKVKAGAFHRIGMVRKLGESREETRLPKDLDTSDAAALEKAVTAFVDSIVVRQWSDITFYIDGAAAGNVRYAGAPDLGHPGVLEIGRGRRSSGDQPFAGIIGEARIWNTARDVKEIGADLPVTEGRTWDTPTLRPEGLIARWRFEEKLGNLAADDAGSHQVRLHGVKWVKNPDPKGSAFRLYLNGRPTQSLPLAAVDAPARGSYGSEQFALGGRVDGNEAAEPYLGVFDQVRIWRVARSEEQILDNLFGRLIGDIADLIAYYPFDDESTEAEATAVRDHGPRALDLPLPEAAAARPAPLMSTAPISSDSPEVRPVFATGQPGYVRTISGTPAVGEYADLQRNRRDGSTRGVLKRAYGYVQDGAWNLVTGYKLGDLKSEWVSQVQFDPQLVGYVEGAPPIPSENLVATRRLSSLSYINATSVEFQQADHVVQTLSSGGESSVDTSLAVQFNNTVDNDTLLIQAPLGIGVATPAASVDNVIGLGGTLEYSNAWGHQTDVAEGVDTARSTTVGLSGGWEPDTSKDQIDPDGGRRFVPANTGYALVQSETADVFALRIEHSGAVVAYRMLPNPDIPRDWNLLPFPLNPRYVKQGTLDGTVGFTATGKLLDPDYKDASDYGEYSYFKPREAYALKRRITEDQQRRQAFYEGLSAGASDPDPTFRRAEELLSRFTGPIPGPGKDRGAKDEAGAFARRDLVNTYVWSADGGFFAETTETTDVVTETTTGSYRFNGTATAGLNTGFTVFGVGIGVQIDSALGGGISRTRAKSKESTRAFGLNVMVDTPGDMQKYDADANPVYKDGKPVEVPGRVDAYRFMTFYLDSDKNNFEDFYGKVVDRKWLEGADPNAAALRQARQSEAKPPCWRVLHRVTFVSRKLPPVSPAGATGLEKAMRSADIASNYELVRRVDPFVDPAVKDRDELTRQVRTAIGANLPELARHSDRIAEFYADFHGIA